MLSDRFDPIGTAFFLRFGYVAEEYPLIKPVNSELKKLGTDYHAKRWNELQEKGKVLKTASGKGSIAEPTAEIDRIIRQELEAVFNHSEPGTFLSGGIDSPLIAAIAQSMTGKRLKAFTFTSDDPDIDESASASEFARAIGLDHHLVRVDESQLVDTILKIIQDFVMPPGDYSVIPTYLVCKAAREYSDTILSGDGGDELFWGYANRMARVIKLSPLFRFPKWYRKLRWWLLHRPYEWNARYFDTVGEWYRSGHEHNFESWLKELFPGLPPLPSSYRQYRFDGTDPDQTAYWVRWNEFSGHMKASFDKVLSASHTAGIEVVSPMFSQGMIDLASELDWWSCLDLENMTGKLPLRQLLGKYCCFQSGSKQGFGSPMGRWLVGPLRELFEESVLRRESLGGLELNTAGMRAVFENQIKGKEDRSWGLWIFLSLALWEDAHKSW